MKPSTRILSLLAALVFVASCAFGDDATNFVIRGDAKEVKGDSRTNLRPNSATEDSFQQESTMHITHAKQWALAAIMFADDHQSQLPEKFEQLKIGVSKELLADTSWEMVSGGNLNDFTNPPQTMLTILLREKESSRSPDGKFVKAYAFADGHTEMISSPDNDFAALEKQRGFLVHPAKN